MDKDIASFGIVVAIQIALYEIFGKGIPCVFRMFTGLLCPGCGMTHAVGALLQGNVLLAFQYNALSITLVPAMGLYLMFKFRQYLKKENQDFKTWEIIFLIICLALCVGYFIYRNFII